MQQANLHTGLLWLLPLLMLLPTGCTSHADSSAGEDVQTLEKPRIDPRAARLLIRAEDAFGRGLFNRALVLTDSAYRYGPDVPQLHFLRARIYTRLNRYDRAQAAYDSVLALSPHHQGVWQNKGNIAFRRGEFDQALAMYQKEKARHPTTDIFLQIGRAQMQLDRLDRARRAYLKALAIDSTNASAYYRLSRWYETGGNTDRALQYARQALKHDPNNLKYTFAVGVQLCKAGQFEAGIDYLKKVIRQQPWHHKAHYQLGRAFLRLSQEDKAQKHLSKVDSLQAIRSNLQDLRASARIHPRQLKRWLQLADGYRQVDRLDQAIQAYNVAFALAPRSIPLQRTLATLHVRQGNLPAALHYYQGILQQDATLADVWVNLGVVYAKAGNLTQAREAWQTALRYEPGHTVARNYLAKGRTAEPGT